MAESVENLLRKLVKKIEALSDLAGPDHVYREPDMYALTGLRRTQRDDLIRRAKFPPPARAAGEGGRAKIWFGREIAAWQRALKAQRDRDEG